MSRLGTESAFEVLVKARALEAKGKDVVHLEIGEPDFDTPANIVRAGVEALQGGWTHYGPSAGLPDLRKAIADYISRSRGISANPDQVVVTPGGKPIMFYTIIALTDEGDEVIYPNPGFPIYESVIEFIGGVPVPIRLHESKEFSLDVEELKRKITKKTKLLILNSPQNPTGGVIPREDLKEIARLAVERDLTVLSDEIYSEILYEGEHHSIAAFDGMAGRTIILDGFSKTYAMTGWRMGYGVMPEAFAAHVARLMTNTNSCTASFSQRAGIEALTGPQDDARRMVAEFRRRRDVIVDGLNAIPGVTCLRPKGAFYVFPNITGAGWDSRRLADYLLEEAGVATLSGTAFGSHGEGYLRLSYANSVENLQKALDRMDTYIRKIKK
ncbi:pyridoxal phosphate-dependent aminotransferase [bacterium]|nr:pyridoxal phosphate-dependent aminotransferase [bacterium]